MIKKNQGADYNKVTPLLVDQVKKVIADADIRKYHISEVYAVHNAVYGLRESPQSCHTCLRNRVCALRDWFKGYEEYRQSVEVQPSGKGTTGEGGNKQEDGETEVAPQYDVPAMPGYVAQVEGTVRYPMAEGIPFDFLPNEGTEFKGKVKRADGSKIRPGKYITADGRAIVVQPGGRANIREVDLT
jgi:hypothetical protein